MKREFVCWIVFIVIALNCQSASAQDTLLLVTGAKVVVDIKEVNDEFILFTMWPDTMNITKLPLDRVDSFTTRDGKSHQFKLKPEEEKVILATLPQEPMGMEAMAKADAKKHYNYSKITGIGMFFTTVFATPVVGLMVAIPASATPPADKSLNAPNEVYLKNPVYYDAYKKEAHKLKKMRVWAGFGVGVVVDILITAIIVNSIEGDVSLID